MRKSTKRNPAPKKTYAGKFVKASKKKLTKPPRIKKG